MLSLQFKEIGEAYQVLSDPTLRSRYNEFGSSATNLGPEGGFMDPKQLFRTIFGGDAFVEIIGEISFVQLFAEGGETGAGAGAGQAQISQNAHVQETEAKRKRQEREREAKRLRAERVQLLYEKLLKKVRLRRERNVSYGFVHICKG
jgi:DnaJ-class molecular chaperone